MFQDKAGSITVHINKDMFDLMITEASLWAGKETGGMLFGEVSENQFNSQITILKTHIPPDEFCLRKKAFFEIDPEYAKEVVSNEKLAYLGNWHVHLGYGGPSYGDLSQIEDFFSINPHLDIILAFIIDHTSEDEYQVIIEVYRRNVTSSSENNRNFEIYRVSQENITYFTDESVIPKIRKGISRDKIKIIKDEILKVYNYQLSENEILDYEGSILFERIISFPYEFLIDLEGKEIKVRLFILISIPPEFPDGKIYIDISSQDLSKNITFEKHPASIIADDDLIQPFFLSLKVSLEDDVSQLLKEPLWKVLSSMK